jgi:hypothetical protein
MIILFGLVLAVFALLAAIEIYRYNRARRFPDDLPYPRRRLSRRIAISLIFSAMVGLVTFWPEASPWIQITLLFLLCLGMVLGLVLLWRDLHETSRAVMEHVSGFTRQAEKTFHQTIDASSEVGGKETDRSRKVPD